MSDQPQNTSSTISQVSDAPSRMAEAARTLGLKPVRAWVPDERSARSAGAERVRRFREEAEQRGLKQLSITVPSELHPALKALAKRAKSGEDVALVLAQLMPALQSGPVSPTASNPVPTTVLGLSGWRRWFLWLLLPDEQRDLLGRIPQS